MMLQAILAYGCTWKSSYVSYAQSGYVLPRHTSAIPSIKSQNILTLFKRGVQLSTNSFTGSKADDEVPIAKPTGFGGICMLDNASSALLRILAISACEFSTLISRCSSTRAFVPSEIASITSNEHVHGAIIFRIASKINERSALTVVPTVKYRGPQSHD